MQERPAAPLLGAQKPRIEWRPPSLSSSGQDAVDLAAIAGLHLDPWQQYVLDLSLGERADGQWSAFEVGLIVSRQSGKGSILEARELAGLFLFGERLIVHSAHLFKTARAAMKRIKWLIDSTPSLAAEVKTWSMSHGAEGVVLKSGQELTFATRSNGGGRGLSADCLILDEAMYVSDPMVGDLMPIISARPNAQIWYTGSAVNQDVHPNGMAFTRIRNRGVKGNDDRLAFAEWSAPGTIEDHDPLDRELWAASNPGLGYRLREENIAVEQRSMPPRQFAVERLGIGDWPSEELAAKIINPAAWRRQAEPDLDGLDAQPAGDLAFAVEVNPARGSAAISSSWKRVDGDRQVEVIDNREGTNWVPDRLAELVAEHRPCAVVLDVGHGPSNALTVAIENAGVVLTKPSVREFIQACGAFYAGIAEGGVRHPNEPMLNEAAGSVKWRLIGKDAQAFERRNPAADMAPFMACVLALFGVDKHGRDGQPFHIW